MDRGFLLQTGASLIAILALAGLAAWAKIARPAGRLDAVEARRRLADEFPEHAIDAVWVAADGRSAIGRAGDEALLLSVVGDGLVARSRPWAEVAALAPRDGVLFVPLRDVAAPRLRFRLGDGVSWPPMETRSWT